MFYPPKPTTRVTRYELSLITLSTEDAMPKAIEPCGKVPMLTLCANAHQTASATAAAVSAIIELLNRVTIGLPIVPNSTSNYSHIVRKL